MKIFEIYYTYLHIFKFIIRIDLRAPSAGWSRSEAGPAPAWLGQPNPDSRRQGDTGQTDSLPIDTSGIHSTPPTSRAAASAARR